MAQCLMLQYIYFLENSPEIFNFVIFNASSLSVPLSFFFGGTSDVTKYGKFPAQVWCSGDVTYTFNQCGQAVGPGLLAMICHHGQSNCVLMSKLRKLLQKGAYKL